MKRSYRRGNPLCCQARRYPSADGFLCGSSQIRAALRCFVSKREMKSRTGTQNTRTCALWSNSALGSTHQQPTRGASRPELRAVRSARDTNDVQNVDRAQNSDNNAEVVASEWQLPPFCDCRKECRPQRSVGLGAGDPLPGHFTHPAERVRHLVRGGYFSRPGFSKPKSNDQRSIEASMLIGLLVASNLQ